MNKYFIPLCMLLLLAGCKNGNKQNKRIAIAQVGSTILYYDEMPQIIQRGVNDADSIALFQNYINKWAKRKLLLQKAEENLTTATKEVIEKQIGETRSNLLIYEYQQKMIVEKLDTVITDSELENYYAANEKSFMLMSNIVKALFIKLPHETPDISRIRNLIRSNDQKDQQTLETFCYQFAEKFDDFNEEWIPMNRLTTDFNEIIENEDDFLRRNTFIEKNDSTSIYLVSIRDFRLRSSLAPFEYVKDDIKRIIWNTRRFEFIQSLENDLYNDALKENTFKIYNSNNEE